MTKRWEIPLLDILTAIEYIAEDTAGIDESAFLESRPVRQLVERNFEIISEASRRLSEEIKRTRPEISWRKIADIGNVLRHEYESVNHPELWRIIQEDLPPLKVAVEAMAAEEGLPPPIPPTPPGRA